MKKYYNIYKYENGYLVINFVGEEKKANINEQEIETILDTFLTTLSFFENIIELVSWLRNILKDYEEKEMFVTIKLGNIEKKAMFETKELVSYKNEEYINFDGEEVCFISNFTRPYNITFSISKDKYTKISPKLIFEYEEKNKITMNEILELAEYPTTSLQEDIKLVRKMEEEI